MEIAELSKTIGAITTLEKALKNIQGYVYVLDNSLRDYAIRKGNLDSDLLELLNVSHETWVRFDDLIDKLNLEKWGFQDQRKEQKKATLDVKGLEGSNVKRSRQQAKLTCL